LVGKEVIMISIGLREQAERAFISLIADVIDGIQYGRKVSAGKEIGSYRSPVRRPSWTLGQLRRINQAIEAGRNLDVLQEIVIKFSWDEMRDLQSEIWNYRKLEMYLKIKERILELLCERGIPEPILGKISDNAEIISRQVKAGTWTPP
jgi:hypothetical protein